VVHLFSDYAALWIGGLTVEHKTHRFYRSGINFWLPRIGSEPIDTIKQSTLKTHLAEAAKVVSAQAINCYLLSARGVFALAAADEVIERDPTKGLKNHRVKLKKPDPLTREECDRILRHMAQKYDPQVSNYFEFSLLTGMRPEEVIALTWAKIDWTKRTALVDAARVDGRDKDTKTHTDRQVDLTERAMEVLKRQKAHTFLKDLNAEIFANPATGRAWRDTAVQLKDYWHPTLKALGIRGRVAYQTRHTYATLALMEGVNVVYLAKQLGHSPVICLRHYGTWIPGEDNGREKAKLETSHGQFRGQFKGSDSTGQEGVG
jgi:integrase